VRGRSGAREERCEGGAVRGRSGAREERGARVGGAGSEGLPCELGFAGRALSLRAPQNGASASAPVPARPARYFLPACPPESAAHAALPALLCPGGGSPLMSGKRIQTNSWLAMAGRILKETIQVSEEETPLMMPTWILLK
jgi:hypothetical protein